MLPPHPCPGKKQTTANHHLQTPQRSLQTRQVLYKKDKKIMIIISFSPEIGLPFGSK